MLRRMNARDVDALQKAAWERKRKDAERTARLDALLDAGMPLEQASRLA